MSFLKAALHKWQTLKLLCKISCILLSIWLEVTFEVYHDIAQKTIENDYCNNLIYLASLCNRRIRQACIFCGNRPLPVYKTSIPAVWGLQKFYYDNFDMKRGKALFTQENSFKGKQKSIKYLLFLLLTWKMCNRPHVIALEIAVTYYEPLFSAAYWNVCADVF